MRSAALACLCLLLGCSTPTTVLVRFSTADGALLDDLDALITLGAEPLDAAVPHALHVGHGVASGTFLVPLDGAPATPVRIELEGHSAGLLLSGMATVTSVPHAQVTMDIVLGGSVADGGVDLAAPCAFCDDFDDRDTLQGKWTSLATTGSGSLSDGTLSSSVYDSAPHSAAFHAPAYTAAQNDGLYLTVVLPLDASETFTIDLDLQIVGYTGGSGYIEIVSIGAGGKYFGGLTVDSTTQLAVDRFVEAPDGGLQHPIGHATLANGWHHLRYAATLSASAGAMHAELDGASVLDATNVQTWAGGALPTTLSLSIGTSSSNQAGSLDVYFDDVRIQ